MSFRSAQPPARHWRDQSIVNHPAGPSKCIRHVRNTSMPTSTSNGSVVGSSLTSKVGRGSHGRAGFLESYRCRLTRYSVTGTGPVMPCVVARPTTGTAKCWRIACETAVISYIPHNSSGVVVELFPRYQPTRVIPHTCWRWKQLAFMSSPVFGVSGSISTR